MENDAENWFLYKYIFDKNNEQNSIYIFPIDFIGSSINKRKFKLCMYEQIMNHWIDIVSQFFPNKSRLIIQFFFLD